MARKYKYKHQTLPFDVQTMSVEGRGIAEIDGKKVFIFGALENEKVSATVMRQHSRFLEAKIEDILEPSDKRIDPVCQFFGQCGGCQLQHLPANEQIKHKNKQLSHLLEHADISPNQWMPPVTGPTEGYRYKARLAVRFVEKKGGILVGFREAHSNKIVEMSHCHVIHPRVGPLIKPLADLIAQLSCYQEIPQIELSAGDTEIALIFRVLTSLLEKDMELITYFAKQHDIQIYLQPKGPDSVTPLWPKESKTLSYKLTQGLVYEFHPLDFTQINPFINQKMVTQALAWLQITKQDTVLDLFCGLGNFSLALAQQAKNVVGVEGDALMVARAQRNAAQNHLANTAFYEANLFEACEQLPWYGIEYDKVLIDPPRSGAQAVVENIHKIAPRSLLYVSCDMNTFVRDAAILCHQQQYQLDKVAILDMFPHTKHVETMGLFVRK